MIHMTERAAADGDFERLRALVRRCAASGVVPAYASIGDLDWWNVLDERGDVLAHARLWLAGDTLVAAALPAYGRVDIFVDPAYPDLHQQALAWAEDRRRAELSRLRGLAYVPRTLGAWSFTADSARTAALQRRGYTRQADHFILWRRSVEPPYPQVIMPIGYRLRTMSGEADIERRIHVHQDAFAPSPLTVERYRRVFAAASYNRDLDLIVEAPNATFAAFATVWYDPVLRFGVFEPVGVYSSERRRGLGKLLMVEGLRRLRTLGAHAASVMSWWDGVAANRLYASCGFAEVERVYLWETTV